MRAALKRGEPSSLRPSMAFPLALAACLFALPFLADSGSSRPISEVMDLHEGAYYYLVMQSGNQTNGSDIDAVWHSTRPIDVWIVDRANFEQYERESNFDYELQETGTAGAVRFNISASRQADEPFYLIIDNTARGPAAPPPDNAAAVATVTFEGETRMLAYSSGSTTPNLAGKAFADFMILVGAGAVLGILVLFLVLRRRRKLRRAAIREQLHAGMPPPAPPFSAPSLGPPAPGPPTARTVFCGSCGTRLLPGVTFCTECGAPV